MIAQLTGFDYVVLGGIGLFALLGLMRGFVQETLNLGAWVAGAIAVRFFHETATLWLAARTGNETLAAIAAFLLLFVGVMLLVRMLASFTGGWTRRTSFGAIDRMLGLGLGAIKGVILVAAAFLIIEFGSGVLTPGHRTPDWIAKSRSGPLLAFTADAMVGWVRDLRDPDRAHLADGAEREGGYHEQDRRALDRLLDEQEGIAV